MDRGRRGEARAPRAGIVAIAAWLVAAPGVPHAGDAPVPAVPVDVVDRRSHYEVHAVDAAGLAREMAERGPQHPTGQRAWAYTAWELRARYAVEAGPGGCRLLDPAVVLDVTTTLPHWRPASPAPARLRASWSRMLAKAAEHEAEHRRHAVDAAQAAAIEMAGVTMGEDCADVERRVSAALRRASHAAARRSRAYDAVTDYGRRAGVRLVD